MTDEYWNHIVESCYRDIYSFALKILGSVHDAEEVTQETFLQAFKNLKGDEPLTVLRPWLYTTARNRCIDRKRWWKRWTILAKELFAADKEDNQNTQALDTLPIMQLPGRQREIFVLRHWHGFSTEETAKILGISEGSVKSHLKRAVEKLKITMFKEEI